MNEGMRGARSDGAPESPAGPDPQYGQTRRVVGTAGVVQAGLFRCPREHPLFRDSGPTRNFVAAFPRTSGCVLLEGRGRLFVSPEVAPLYNRGQRYVRTGLNRGGDRTDWIALTDAAAALEIVREFDPWAEERPDAPLPATPAPVPAALYARQRFLIEAMRRRSPPDALAFEEEALAVFRAVVRSACAAAGLPGPKLGGGAESAVFLRARMAVEHSYRGRVDLATIASRAGISAVHLARVFRRHSGASVHRTITALRLRDSLDRLREARADIGSIALDLGFSDHSHFTASFRRAFGFTPSRARAALSRGGWRELRDRAALPTTAIGPGIGFS
jgi:AraC-like DNA-binding protein